MRSGAGSAQLRLTNRIEAQFTTLPYFALARADHMRHEEQETMIRCYLVWCKGLVCYERTQELPDEPDALACKLVIRSWVGLVPAPIVNPVTARSM